MIGNKLKKEEKESAKYFSMQMLDPVMVRSDHY